LIEWNDVGGKMLTQRNRSERRRIPTTAQWIFRPDHIFEFWKDHEECYRERSKTPLANRVADVPGLLAAGIRMM